MAFSTVYKPLFKVNIFHQFFLNKGTDEFKTMSIEKKARQLENYDCRTVFSVLPTPETIGKLAGHNLVFKTGNSGFTVWGKVTGNNSDEPFIAFENNLDLTFLLKMNDSAFFNYTDLKLENAGNIFYFSNRKKVTEPANFPLIDKAGGNHTVKEDLVLSAEGEKNERELLDAHSQKNLFGIVRIFIKADAASLNITDNQNKIPESFQSFELNFKNRETTWRYFFETNQQVSGNDSVKQENGNPKILITRTEKPLTQNGFISVELGDVELPNPDARLVKPDTLTNKFYSEIYM